MKFDFRKYKKCERITTNFQKTQEVNGQLKILFDKLEN